VTLRHPLRPTLYPNLSPYLIRQLHRTRGGQTALQRAVFYNLNALRLTCGR